MSEEYVDRILAAEERQHGRAASTDVIENFVDAFVAGLQPESLVEVFDAVSSVVTLEIEKGDVGVMIRVQDVPLE
jgi:hypothetical protein